MDKIMIGINFVKFGWIVTVPLVILGIIGDIFNSKIAEFIFAFFKSFFYGCLAYFMWKYVNINQLNELDIILGFTSVFAGLECGDNLVKVIGMIIQYIKTWIKILKEREA